MTILPAQPSILPPLPAPGTTRIVHTADIHLRPSAHGSTARGEDFFKAALSVLDIASQRGAKAVINAGDFIDAPELLSGTFGQVRAFHEHAKDLGLPVYTIMGNHDMCQPSWASHIADGDTGIVCADNREITIGAIRTWHLPFMSPEDLKCTLAQRLGGAEVATPIPRVLVWHGAVKEWTGFPVEGAIEVANFVAMPFEAVLLGDIHITDYKQFTLNNGRKCLIGYPGATEMARENDPLLHYCTVIDFDNQTGAVLGFELVRVDHRYVLPLRIDTEAHLAESLLKVRQVSQEHQGRIMVLAACADTVTGVAAAIRREAGSAAVIRVNTYPVVSFAQAMAVHGSGNEPALQRKPEDYMQDRIPGNKELAALSRQLCNPDAPSIDLLRAYTAQQYEITL